MLKSLYRSSRQFGARVLRRWSPPQRIVHSLPTEQAFFNALDSSAAPEVSQAKASFRDGDRNDAAKAIVAYFRNRQKPYFFISTDEIYNAVDEVARLQPKWIAETLRKADDMALGNIDVYAQRSRLLYPEDWAFAPLGPGSDVLYRERPHRFSFAPRLAIAALYGHGEALTTLEKWVKDWSISIDSQRRFAKRCRLFKASSHVALYRSIAVSWTLAFLSALKPKSVELEFLLLRIIAGDAQYIYAEMPETTRNNHLLADGFGLWYLGSLYPEFADAAKWTADGLPIFQEELRRQVNSDGSSFEQSIHYQEHACEMGLAYLLLCRRNSCLIETELTDLVKAMLFFQSSLSGQYDRVFPIGDTTEDPLFPLDIEEKWCGSALRWMYASVFGEQTLPVERSAASLERAFWLGGGSPPDFNSNVSPLTSRIDTFPVGGFAVLHAKDGRDCLVFRTGPAEEVDLVSGHMHCDYLSVYLVVDGQPVFVPSGTYTYRANPLGWPRPYMGWREYFMSSRAANGLSISSTDLLQRGHGDFPGGIGATVACRVQTNPVARSESLTLISAKVVGTGEYVGWARSILQVKDDYWLILDCLPDAIANTPAWLGLQCAVGASIESHDMRCLQIIVNGAGISLSFSPTLDKPECLEGSLNPRGGWVSPSYGQLQKAPQLLFPVKRDAEVSAIVVARHNDSMSEIKLAQARKSENGVELRIVGSDFQDQIEIPLISGEAPTNVRCRRLISGKVTMEENI